MALIKCPECGKMISDKAPSCINCGLPISSNNGSSEQPTAPKRKKRLWWVLLLVMLLIGGFAYMLFMGGDKPAPISNTTKTVHHDSLAKVEREQFVRDSTEKANVAAEQKRRDEEAARKAEQQLIDDMIAQGLGRDGVYKVGDLYNENGKQGVVFEVWDGGRHGKIVSLDETKKMTQWCTQEQYEKKIALGLTNKSNGKENTDKVMSRDDSDQYPAFVWCRNKGADWYLPAYEELCTIRYNNSAINSTLAKYNAKQIASYYWSSTEYEVYKPEFSAWLVLMNSDYTGRGTKKYLNYVRAVSAF